jgi:hypothetical protein
MAQENSMSLTGFFHTIEQDFLKLFKKTPSFIHFALALVTYAAPFVEGVLAVVDPAAAALVDPIITRMETGLTTIYSLANQGTASGATLATTLAAFQSDLSTLEAVGGIKDAATQAKIATITSEVQAIIALIPAAAPAAA